MPGARAPGPSQAWEPASRRKWVPPLPLQRPLPPPPPPQSQARPPRTCAKRHRRVPERRDRSWRRDGNPAAPALRRRGAGRGTGRGRKGQGERRVKGRPGARRARPQRSGHAGAAAATAEMRPGRSTRPPAPCRRQREPWPTGALSSTSPTAIPVHLPDPLCCLELGPQRCQALAPLRSEHACGTPSRPGAAETGEEACTPRVPQFTSSGVPHSPVHYSLPHPLLHPGRDPFLRPRKRKLRVAREGRVGVGKSAGKEVEGGGREKFWSVGCGSQRGTPHCPACLPRPPRPPNVRRKAPRV